MKETKRKYFSPEVAVVGLNDGEDIITASGGILEAGQQWKWENTYENIWD